jgi:hypothetical protein
MGLPASGRRDAELKTALRASWGLKIFGLKTTDGRERESWRRLYADCEFLNELRDDGAASSANRLWFAPWYLESLNAFHAAPIDYDLWKTLDAIGPLASRLYEYLVPTFYKRETLEFAYERLAAAMPVVIESRRSHAIRQFSAALNAATEHQIIARFTWDAMKGSGRPKLVLDRGKLLAPAETSKSPPANAATNAVDSDIAKSLATEFYRLMGTPETVPLRSDLAISGALLAKHGADRAAALLPAAVRILKTRFRNAETMGALVRYVDEAARNLEKHAVALEKQKVEHNEKTMRQQVEEQADQERKRLWDALTDVQQSELREKVLSERPSWKRYPSLVEAHCIASLNEPIDPNPQQRTVRPAPRRAKHR